MSIKHILVHLDNSPQSRFRLEFALGMARRQQAFLTGCFADTNAVVSHGQEQLRSAFLEQTAAGAIASQWLRVEATAGSQALIFQLCRTAQCCDLVIVGQHDPKNNAAVPRELPEKLVLHSGRPVLILPYAGQYDPRCERVMVAWNGGRESTRAVHDALPLLQQAKQVSLLSLLSAGDEEAGLDASLALLRDHLAHHGIQARTEKQISMEIGKGDTLLNRSAEEGAGLLVAGGYYQDKLGDIAGHLLKHMTVPLLMSH